METGWDGNQLPWSLHCDLALGLSCSKPPAPPGFQSSWLMTSVHKGQKRRGN